MAKLHIKVHQVYKAQAVKIPGGVVQGVLHTVGIALVVDMLGGAPAGEDVVDFSHGQTVETGFLDGVQHGFLRRLQGKVMPVGGSAEGFRAAAHIGPGDDPAHAVFTLQNGPGLPAGVIQLFQRDPFLVGSHLKDGVGGGVDNPLAGFLLLHAVVTDHIGAGVGLVAQNAPASGFCKGLQHLRREALGIGGQGPGGGNTGNLPVADGGVLAHGHLCQPAQGAGGIGLLGQVIHPVQITQARLQQVGDGELRGGGAGAQGVDAHVSKGRPVRQLAHAAGIQDNEKNTLHITCSPWQRPHPEPPSSWW